MPLKKMTFVRVCTKLSTHASNHECTVRDVLEVSPVHEYNARWTKAVEI